VFTRARQQIALFFVGRKHPGENLATVLAQRAEDLGPPIQMCDALSRNLPKEFKSLSGKPHRQLWCDGDLRHRTAAAELQSLIVPP
jgi:hypothetical protein